MRVLFASSEAAPFAKVGGLADVVGSLPHALAGLGHDVRVALPLYASMDRVKFALEPSNGVLPVRFAGETVPVTIHELTRDGVHHRFFEDPAYLTRAKVYGEADDVLRFGLFCRAVVDDAAGGSWRPDVVHAHDWHTGLVPQLIKQAYPDGLEETASVFTIHNLAYQGVTKERILHRVGLPEDHLLIEKRRFGKQVSPMARGIAFADVVSTVSPRYAAEIVTREFGEGLDALLEERRTDLYGILNGIDTELFDPARDPHLVSNYGVDDLSGKAEDKLALQIEFGLAEDPATPLFGAVGRLVEQKGVDLLTAAARDLLDLGAQLVILGAGDPAYEAKWKALAAAQRGRVGLTVGFDLALAQRIYAGVDLFLMPSRFEPCGLGQLISLRYGTVPVVHRVGGLVDTVHDADEDVSRGNGFSFGPYTPAALVDAARRAIRAYRDGARWRELVRRGMREDHSWHASALLYGELYETALASRRREDGAA